MFKFITHRPLWLNIIAGIVLAFGLFFIVITSLKWCTNHGASKTVPSVVGKNYEQAKKLLSDAGFEVVIQDSIYTDTTGASMVLKQVPEGDEIVKVNRTVYLTINRAVPPMIDMPNLVGYSLRSAEMALKNNGLKMGDTTFRPDFALNSVLEQSVNGVAIKAGTKIRMGSVIDLVLGDGLGEQEFVVPNLIGKTYCEAKMLLEQNDLSFASVLAPGGVSDTCNAFIYRQNPERLNIDKKNQYIRSGQTMDVWLQLDRPVVDSTGMDSAPAPQPE